jgi:hypothetical protein
MKHKYVKYKWNNTWQCSKEEYVWYREKDKHGDILISMCNMGDYALNLSLFCTFACDFDEALKMKNPPMIWGYDFTLYTNSKSPLARYPEKAEAIYCCSLSNGLWFDTKDINVAEKTAEYLWKKMYL